MNMENYSWGHDLWRYLHRMSLHYPLTPTAEDKQKYSQFIYAMMATLPCDQCQSNMQKHLARVPLNDLALSNRHYFVKWMIDFHNAINQDLGKRTLSYDEAFASMQPTHSSKYNIGFVIGGIVLLILCVVIGLQIYRRISL